MRFFVITLLIFVLGFSSEPETVYIEQLKHSEFLPPIEEVIGAVDSLVEDVISDVKDKILVPLNNVSGKISSSKKGVGIPELSIYLVHPTHGRSSVRKTSESGSFEFQDLPFHSKNDKDFFYIEVYWGDDLYYQNSFFLKPGPNYFEIKL